MQTQQTAHMTPAAQQQHNCRAYLSVVWHLTRAMNKEITLKNCKNNLQSVN